MRELNPLNVKYFELAISPKDLGKRTPQDYSARCPICGDSKRNKNKKRFHLYTKNTYDDDVLHCFNGDCGYSATMFTFLKEFKPQLLNAYLQEKKQLSFNNLKNHKSDLEILEDTLKEKKIKNEKKPSILFNLPKEFTELKQLHLEYLSNRKLYINKNLAYTCEDIILDKQRNFSDMIIFPLFCGNKLYGFQGRSIYSKKFFTYIPNENSGFKVWNWFNIDKSKPVYIFESIFDALSSGLDLNEIVAALGSDIPNERLKELKEPIFCFDNQHIDKTARNKSIKLLKKGYKALIWKNIPIKDFNDLLIAGAKPQQIKKFIKTNIETGIKGLLKLID